MLAGEHRAGAAESCQDLIGDEERAKSIAERARSCQEFARPDHHTAGCLQHRLDQHCGDRVSALRQGSLQTAQTIDLAARAFETQRTPIAVRRFDPNRLEQHRRERLREDRGFTGGHRADGVAVIGVMQGDEPVTLRLSEVPPILQRQLERDLNGCRAVVGIEHPGQPFRQDADETLGQFNSRTMGTSGEDDVFELASLLGQRFVEAGVRVAVNVHPPG